MAQVTLLTKSNLQLGETLSPTVKVLSGDREVKINLDTALAAWDDPAIRITITCERWDGTQWLVKKSTTFIGATRGKEGGLPSISVTFSGTDEKDCRFRLVTNKRFQLGLLADVPTV